MDTTLLDAPQEGSPQVQTESFLSAQGHSAILKSIGWIRFAGIILCLVGGILVLATILMFFYSYNTVGVFSVPAVVNFYIAVGLFYGTIAAATIVLGVLLLNSASAYSDYATFREGNVLDRALGRTRTFWMVLGIAIISALVVFFSLVLTILGILASINDAF